MFHKHPCDNNHFHLLHVAHTYFSYSIIYYSQAKWMQGQLHTLNYHVISIYYWSPHCARPPFPSSSFNSINRKGQIRLSLFFFTYESSNKNNVRYLVMLEGCLEMNECSWYMDWIDKWTIYVAIRTIGMRERFCLNWCMMIYQDSSSLSRWNLKACNWLSWACLKTLPHIQRL